jgi:multidrug efflux system outer membrane protein
MNKVAIRIAPLLAALLLVACSTVPALKPVHVDTPAAFKESAEPVEAADGTRWKLAQPAEAQARGEWWLAFNDPALTALIHEATAANASLAGAAARVKQARALAGIAASDRSVQVGAGLGGQRSGAQAKAPSTSYQARLTASYEIDLFGRVGASVSAAQADAAASEATYKSVLLALQADVAQTYFRLRETDAELASLHRTVDLRTQAVKVNQSRFDNGDIGEFDLARSRTELATAKAEAIGLQRQRVQNEHALAVLLGKPAALFTASVSPLVDTALLPKIPAGLPSALLERRPDISAAQRALVAANARIGVARAARFPALTLDGGAGGSALSASNLFNWSSRSWVLGALLSMPLIDGGRNKANIARSEAVLEESVAAYRQNVLVAFAEVEDNLAGLRILAGQTEQIDAAVVAARRSADLAQKLYGAGRSSYLDLLDAQRNLATVERQAVQLRGNQAVTTVALVRSLGGAW